MSLDRCPFCKSKDGFQYKMTVEYIQMKDWSNKPIGSEQTGNGDEAKRRFCISCGVNLTWYIREHGIEKMEGRNDRLN